MPSLETVLPSPLVRRSRDVRKWARREQQVSLGLTAAARLPSRDKSSELCRQSEELLRRSHQLCERLRKLRNAP